MYATAGTVHCISWVLVATAGTLFCVAGVLVATAVNLQCIIEVLVATAGRVNCITGGTSCYRRYGLRYWLLQQIPYTA